MSAPQNTYEFYYKLAAAVSQKTLTNHFDPTDKISVDVDGETFEVGPFEEAKGTDTLWEAHYMFSYPNTDFAIGLSDDNWSSWGHMYGDEGNDFDVFKKFNPKVVYDYDDTYDELSKLSPEIRNAHPFPKRGPRW